MISILLPFRNAETTIRPCLASISNQTLSHFEMLAVNDHSSDRTQEIIEGWPDSRIQLLNNPGKGLVDALNYGLRMARYPLIARMDADDLMRTSRLMRQFEMLQDHSDLTVIGSRVALFPRTLVAKGYQEYIRWQNSLTSHQSLLNQRFVESPLAHPSVMFRKQVILDAGGYRSGDFPEDYELWLRLLQAGHKFGKHTDILLDWRESDNRLSKNHAMYRRPAFDRLRANYLEKLTTLSRRPVAYWGAGRKTRLRAQRLVEKGIKPWVWIDIDPKKIGNQIQQIPVTSPDILLNHDQPVKPFVLVYVTNHGARDLIQQELESYGYMAGEDYLAVG